MNNRWTDDDAAAYQNDPVGLRAYSSRLLGSDPDLVLHGGGNTSVKVDTSDIFGDTPRLLYVKGSGWDLASIEPAGFTPLRLNPVRRLAQLGELSDVQMMRALRSFSVDPDAPSPSVETITHAIIPHRFVDHTHADAIVTISSTPEGEDRLRRLYDESVLILPYAMPGFVLAKLIDEATKGFDWDKLRALVLMNYGVFTFDDDAHKSYDIMIKLVSMAEAYLETRTRRTPAVPRPASEDMESLAALRKAVADTTGKPVVARLDSSPEARTFVARPDASELASRGCLTPDHVIHVKSWPATVSASVQQDVTRFAADYEAYFSRHAEVGLTQLDPGPRWALWPDHGTVAFGVSAQRTRVVQDIARHTIAAAQQADELASWKPIGGKDLFDVEYWDLEQAKLRRRGTFPPLEGRIAVVTGAASGIGRACVDALLAQGAAVAGLDVNSAVVEQWDNEAFLGVRCDVTDTDAVDASIRAVAREYGGIDIVIANAGTFPAGQRIDAMDDSVWNASLDINLSGHLRVIRATVPYLRLGIDPAPGAAAYSAAKAGLTQLARVAALELGSDGIRVNVLHPNAVFDTGIWTDEILAERARQYGLTVYDYRRNNVLGVEVSSADVAALACAMASPLFAKTTGAQVPVDGGNERVI